MVAVDGAVGGVRWGRRVGSGLVARLDTVGVVAGDLLGGVRGRLEAAWAIAVPPSAIAPSPMAVNSSVRGWRLVMVGSFWW